MSTKRLLYAKGEKLAMNLRSATRTTGPYCTVQPRALFGIENFIYMTAFIIKFPLLQE